MPKASSGFCHIEHNIKPPAWPSEAFVVWFWLPFHLHLFPLCPLLENSNRPGLLVVCQAGQIGSHHRASVLAFSSPGPFFFLEARSLYDSLPCTIQVSAQLALYQLVTAHLNMVSCPPHFLFLHHALFSLSTRHCKLVHIYLLSALTLDCKFPYAELSVYLFPPPQYLT